MKVIDTTTRRPRIAVLGMGGTIAMVPGPYGALVPAKSAEELIDSIPLLQGIAEIEVFQIENLDSCDLDPGHWTKLSLKIAELYQSFDAFIVTHGTDTMSYTSGAVSLALGPQLTIPIIFTGSQLPLIALGNEARTNLENSVQVAITCINQHIAEVMIVMGHRVLRASRSIKVSEADFDAFRSPAFPELGVINATGVTMAPEARRVTRLVTGVDVRSTFDTRVLTIDVMPGLDPKLICNLLSDGAQQCRALVLRSLGAGNVPAAFLSVIRAAIDSHIAVFIATKFVGGRALPMVYESGRRAVELGAAPTGDMTEVMVQLKLMWLLGMGVDGDDQLQRHLLEDYVGEVTVPHETAARIISVREDAEAPASS